MKVRKFLLLLCLVYMWAWASLHAQTTSCKNMDFGLGNFTNWVGYTWRYSELVPSINTSKVKGIVSRRQTIMSDTSDYDANTGYALRKIPAGYLYSARLGDEIISSDANPRCWQQSLRYTMTVDSTNALLILKFALVLQYASDHNALNEPRFKLTLYDSNGNTLPDCSNYDVYSSNKNVKGFKTYTPTTSASGPGPGPGGAVPVEWRDWTTVGANLLKYMGQTITIEFMSTDCTQRYHYGYAYFVAECHPLYITVKYCTADTVAILTAPEGFEKYKWTNSNGTMLDTVQLLNVNVPTLKLSYTCTMTSATGCVVTLQTSIVKYTPKADFSSFMIDCKSNTVQFINLSVTNHGTLSYNWDFGSGNISSLEDPPYTFSTSGMHTVTLILSNQPSACKDTLTKDIESFSPPLVGIDGDSTYCPGLSTWIKAYGTYEYTWSNGSNTDSIEIGAPGGTFWLLGRSNTGCVSDTIYKTIIKEPDWEFLAQGDTIICGSGSVILSASGAVSYLWNNGITKDSVVVSTPGTYIVTGSNARGCEKSLTFNVAGYPLPAVDFSLSPNAIDSKRNILNCSIPVQTGTQYVWNMGDGSSETGSAIRHEYNISNSILYYMITLMATSEHNCIDSSFKYIDVVPFVPNVFSPNGDEINDVFMPGFELEIVDRNGMQIHKGNNGWDGWYNGQPADPDTYFYLIYYKDSKERVHTKKGYVILMR
jgi:gliding motility-associated-like protein